MKLIPKGCTDANEVFHVPTGIGKALILTGTVEEYIPPVKPDQPTHWSIFTGPVGEYAPILQAKCPTCLAVSTWENATGKAPFVHHIGQEFCPANVLENYHAAVNRWNEIHRPKQAAAVREQQDTIRNHAIVWR